jgi:ADP-ribosyl-[dinitrogen reductase] hydrolase
MALCLASSLTELGHFNPMDQMNRYCRWQSEGYWSSNGRCFDIGSTVSAALRRFRASGEPFSGSTDARSAGNGSIMRLAPIPMFFFPNREKMVESSAESSRTTHGAAECVDSCRLLALILYQAFSGAGQEKVLFDHSAGRTDSQRVQEIANGEYRKKTRSDIRGSGYVIECLEAALWCFDKTDTFADAVLAAANLGDDADTTAAVCGQVAGAFYGHSQIPSAWLDRLAMQNEIQSLADRLYNLTDAPKPS